MKYRLMTIVLLASVLGKDPVVRITKLDGTCKDFPSTKSSFNMSLKVKNGVTYIDHYLNVTQEIPMWDKIVLMLQKCPNRDSLNYCEHFRNITIPYFGLLVTNKNTPWGKRLVYHPPLGFPMKPGIYKADRTILGAAFAVVVIKGYWKNTALIMSNKNEVFACVYCEGEIM